VSKSKLEIEDMDWKDEFLPWFKDAWLPGQHIAIIAPTGAGKSVFAKGILQNRRYVLALDAKGGDSTLESYGFPRLKKWPGHKEMAKSISKNDEDNAPSRYLIGNIARTKSERQNLIATMKQTLDEAYEMGGFTVYADELAILTDPRQFNLRAEVDEMLIAARDRGISFVGSFQAPTWVTPQAGKQSTWVAVSYTRDTDVVNRLAEILGRPKSEIRGAIKGLERFSWIIVGRDPREPLRITIPDFDERK
jgi:hypothetical protein